MLLINFLIKEKEEPLCPSECIYGQFSYPLGLALCWGFSINRDRLARTVGTMCALWLQKRVHLQEVGDTLKSTVCGTDRTQLRTDRAQQASARQSKVVSPRR